MTGTRCPLALFMVVALAAIGSLVRGGEEQGTAPDFRAARPAIVQQLRDRDKATRVAAAQKLADYPTADAVKLLLTQVVASKDEDLRRAGFEVLLQLNSNEEVCKLLQNDIAREWKQGRPDAEGFAVLEALLASELPAASEHAFEVLKQAIAKPKGGRETLILLTDDLALRAGDERLIALKQLMTLPQFQEDFAVRRTIAQALTRIRSKPAFKQLIDVLAESKGEVRNDIVRYLSHITGQELGNDAKKWDAWWQENQENFTFPPEDKRAMAAPWVPRALAGPSYYRVPLSGSRLLFVFDTSVSMLNGGRILAAKRELLKALSALPGDVQFNVVVFNTRVSAWRNRLMPANEDNKQNAAYFVEGQNLGNGTASYDALEAAINLDAESIYFVTDGEPYGGKITNPADIVRAITRLNQFRRTTIHTFGIGILPGKPGEVIESFLSTLAEQNYGQFNRVDE